MKSSPRPGNLNTNQQVSYGSTSPRNPFASGQTSGVLVKSPSLTIDAIQTSDFGGLSFKDEVAKTYNKTPSGSTQDKKPIVFSSSRDNLSKGTLGGSFLAGQTMKDGQKEQSKEIVGGLDQQQESEYAGQSLDCPGDYSFVASDSDSKPVMAISSDSLMGISPSSPHKQEEPGKNQEQGEGLINKLNSWWNTSGFLK